MAKGGGEDLLPIDVNLSFKPASRVTCHVSFSNVAGCVVCTRNKISIG